MRTRLFQGIVLLGLIGYTITPASTYEPVAKIPVSRLVDGGTGYVQVGNYSMLTGGANPSFLGIGTLKVFDDYGNQLEDINVTDADRYTDADQASMAYWYDRIVTMLERENETINSFNTR